MIILDDYREWKSQQEERVGTHSDRCHMWPRHEACMIHRLAAEAERLRLTDADREAVETALLEAEAHQHSGRAATLRGLLERHFPASENQPVQDNT